MGLVAVCQLEGLSDELALQILEHDSRRGDLEARLLAGGFCRSGGDLGRKIPWGKLAGLHQDHRALDHVTELAHVAGPLVMHEQTFGLGAEPRHPLLELLAEVLEEVTGQRRDVLAALPEGGGS